MRRLSGAILLLALMCTQAPAQEAMPVPWGNKFFVPKDPPAVIVHDFGTVPQGTLLNHRFTITNIYAVPMQVSDPRVSCGCTSGSVSKRVLQPRESCYLDLTMDARKFSGNRAVTIWVDFGPQYRSTAVLRVQANSRADIAMNPGRLDFGVVAQGRQTAQSIELQYLGGMPDWQILRADAGERSPVEVAVQSTTHQRGRIAYVVTATLKADAPSGSLHGQIQLLTNDPSNPVVAVNVGGIIQAPFRVEPAGPVRLGPAKIGEAAATNVMIIGTRPFKIEKVEGEGDGLVVEQLPPAPRDRQIVKVKFQPKQPGDVKRVLKLYTDAANFVSVSVEANAVGQ